MSSANDGVLAVDALTARQLQIVRLVACGLSNDEIARRLYIQPGTVKQYVSAIRVRLGLQSRPELVASAFVLGVVTAADVADELLPRMRRVAAANREIA